MTTPLRSIERLTELSLRLALRAGRRRVPAPAVDRNIPVRVAGVRRPCRDVALLDLVGRDGRLPAWRPGAHVDVVLPSGAVRQYSLCDGDRDVYRIAVRLLGSGSREVHALPAGAELTLRGPRNAFRFAPAPTVLFLAGGIGITPIAPMVRAAAAAGADWRLIHTGRTMESMPLSGSLAELDPARVTRRASQDPPDVDELLACLPAGCAVYCCGPPPMIDAARAATPEGHRFHSERFSPPPVRDGRPFTVRIAGGPDVEVAADESALDAVRAVRPDVAWSCRQGFCGTCHVPLLDGATVGDTAAPGRTALCVGRAAGDRIVVGLR